MKAKDKCVVHTYTRGYVIGVINRVYVDKDYQDRDYIDYIISVPQLSPNPIRYQERRVTDLKDWTALELEIYDVKE